MSYRNLIVAAFLVILLASTVPQTRAQLNPEPGVTQKEILIGSCAALSGKDGFVGQQTVVGARAYLETVNAQGGVYGRRIRLLSYDHEYNPEKAIACFNRLLAENIFAAAFITGSPTAAKMAPMAVAKKVPMIGLYTGAQFLFDPVQRYIINVKASYEDEMIQAVEHLWKERGTRKFAVLYQNDAAGSAFLEGVKRGLAEFHAEPTALASFERNNPNADAAVRAVKSFQPDVVLVGGAYAPAAAIITRARQIGWNPLFMGYSGIGAEGFVKEAGMAADGVVIASAVPPISRRDLSTVANYIKALKNYYPAERPNQVGFEGYVDAMVLVEGLKRAGQNLTREKLIDAIEGIHNLDMGLGDDLKLDYGPQDHKGFETVTFTIVRNGEIVSFSNWKTLK